VAKVRSASLQIPPGTGGLDALLREVALWRAARAEWQDRIERHHRALAPVRREFRAAWREWVLALDHASAQPGLSRAERDQLGELASQAAAPLLEGEDDAEIAAVAQRHARPVQSAPDATPEAGTQDEPPPDWEQQAAAAAEQRAAWAAQRRAASAVKRRAQQEQAATGSVRDVYRRLASLLHPDREPDAQQRERKTALMQQANQAYADEDLSALIELQRHADGIAAAALAPHDAPQRLAHHLARLQEQLAELQAQTRQLEAQFREAAGLPEGSGLQPRKADRAISSQARMLKEDLLALRRQTAWVRDGEGLKEWLREQR
jgi:hypothetical protein